MDILSAKSTRGFMENYQLNKSIKQITAFSVRINYTNTLRTLLVCILYHWAAVKWFKKEYFTSMKYIN